MDNPKSAAREEWRVARKALVDELTRLRDQLGRGGWVEAPGFSSAAPSR
jgi:hypothetical protein